MPKTGFRTALHYEDHFYLSTADLRKVLEIALSGGGDFAEIYLGYEHFSLVHMEEDIIKETAEAIGQGMGIRVLSGDQTGYGYTSDLAPEKIRKAARTAASIASGKMRDTLPITFHSRCRRPERFGIWGNRQGVPLIRAVKPESEVSLVSLPAHRTPLRKKINLVRDAYASAQSFSPEVKKVKVSFQDSLEYALIINSEGRLARDVRPLVKLVCVVIAEKNAKREYGFCGGGGRVGMEYFESTFPARDIGREAAREAVLLLDAVDAPAGRMPIVLSPGHSGVLIHEAVGHLLEADFNRKKTSIFWNKMGKRVGSDLVTIFDDPTIPLFRGSYNIDDEGTAPSRTLLIEKGVVKGLLQDKLSARLMNEQPTGHGRRQDFSHWPVPRMANTYIDRGEYGPEEILRSVNKGFYVDRLSGGQVEDSGKFTFSVSLGYLIEGGRRTAPVKQATLIGTNVDILKKIDRVGSDLEFGLQTGTCSKEGQDVPVTDGCPTLRISNMIVGGRR